MKRAAFSICAVSFFLAVCAGICRPEDQLNSMDGLETFDGKVVSVDIGKSAVVVQGGTTMTFRVSSGTKIFKDIYPVKLSDIYDGDYVSIGYSTGEDGSADAVTINIRYGNADIY